MFDFACEVEMVCSVCHEIKTMTETHKELCLDIPKGKAEYFCRKLVRLAVSGCFAWKHGRRAQKNS